MMSDKWIDLEGKVALVTGGSGAIGFAIAKELGKLGATVIISGKNEDKLIDAYNKLLSIGIKNIDKIKADLYYTSEIKSMVNYIINKYNKIDILVCNAGIINDKQIFDLTEEEWDYILRVNLTSVFLLTREIAQYMIKQNYGKIVIISSIVGKTGGMGKANIAYTASKAGLLGLTKNLARALAKHNINVNAIAPSFIVSEMLTKSKALEKYEDLIKSIPLGRLGTPEDVAYAVAFLVSDKSSYITGEVLDVNGGLLMD
jgi:3-oxoacyl-[acyl-carrier protein] reductase